MVDLPSSATGKPVWVGSHFDSVPEGGNYDGADKMLRRAVNKFQRLPPSCQGIDAASLLQTCRRLQQTLDDESGHGALGGEETWILSFEPKPA